MTLADEIPGRVRRKIILRCLRDYEKSTEAIAASYSSSEKWGFSDT